MFDNKVLVNLYILSLGKDYEVYLPVNEKIGNISRLFNSTMFDSIDPESNYMLVNVDTGEIYQNNNLIIKTDIRNGTKLLLV